MLTKTIEGTKFLYPDTIEMSVINCYKCNVPFAIPKELKDYFLNQGPATEFYCPNGHSQCYTKSRADKVREELQAIIARKCDDLSKMQDRWLDELGAKNKLEKQLKRVHKGVCPCCNRSFTNLQRHMETKHPETIVKTKK